MRLPYVYEVKVRSAATTPSDVHRTRLWHSFAGFGEYYSGNWSQIRGKNRSQDFIFESKSSTNKQENLRIIKLLEGKK